MNSRLLQAFLYCLLPILFFSFCSQAACPQEEKILYIYGWSGSLDASILKQFEEETGIKVVYDVYDSNDILEAKLLTGKAKFDLVFPSVTPNFIRQMETGVFQPIQQSQLKNYKNLDGRILKLIASFDEHNRYGVPYTLGTTGFGYNKRALKKIFPKGVPQSLSVLFKPENAHKLESCGVLLLDFPQDILEAAQAYMGETPQCQDKGKLEKALSVMRSIRPHVRDFTTNSERVVRELAEGDACFVHLWSNDALLAAREAQKNIEVGYIIPREWPGLWVDMMAIPKAAPHPENAHRFIDFLLRPDIAAQVVKTTFMAVPNIHVKRHLPKELHKNPIIFIPEYALKNLRIQENLSFRHERFLMRKWTHFKLGW